MSESNTFLLGFVMIESERLPWPNQTFFNPALSWLKRKRPTLSLLRSNGETEWVSFCSSLLPNKRAKQNTHFLMAHLEAIHLMVKHIIAPEGRVNGRQQWRRWNLSSMPSLWSAIFFRLLDISQTCFFLSLLTFHVGECVIHFILLSTHGYFMCLVVQLGMYLYVSSLYNIFFP